MPLNKRLLVTALTLVTLSLSPLESFAGPIHDAIQNASPVWLAQAGPRQTRLGMPCGKKVLLGLGIGAGVGAGWIMLLKARGAEGDRSIALTVPVLYGAVGSLVGYRLCR